MRYTWAVASASTGDVILNMEHLGTMGVTARPTQGTSHHGHCGGSEQKEILTDILINS